MISIFFIILIFTTYLLILLICILFDIIRLFFYVIIGLIGVIGLFLNKSNLIQVLISFEVVILCLSFSSEISLSVYPVVLSILVTVSLTAEVSIGLILIAYINIIM